MKGPKGCFLLVWFSYDVWWRRVAQIFAYRKCLCIIQNAATRRVWSGLKGLETRHFKLECGFSSIRFFFGCLDDVPLNFRSQTLKKMKFGPTDRTIQAWMTKKNSNTYNLNTSKPVMTKFFTEYSHRNWAFVDGLTTSSNKSCWVQVWSVRQNTAYVYKRWQWMELVLHRRGLMLKPLHTISTVRRQLWLW